ncbi:hypothetical protein PP2015_2293 [Pseudoalteromonas phenolica]|uniref:Uncharacterized protein n=1 Tax=Pseudoalteromonas phenolica TaxID=161398 RepID=A0A0S2K3B3_9GAMM|nr:hypothetical protein PP2015_2293 [Pseudoalteromonas phenolica]MBE0356078.1 hypothetical protein [Pseudoalteromonas phenolica O-BC30]
MNLKKHKSGFLAGFMSSTALLVSDLFIFGNLQLNQLSIICLSLVSIICLCGFVSTIKSDAQKVS